MTRPLALLAALAALATALGVAAVVSVSGPASAAAPPGWTVRCPYSHSAADDPIVRPHRHGGAHLHDFYGNRTTHASSTYADLVSARSTCRTSGDTGSYWLPALYDHGRRVVPTGKVGSREIRPLVYYRDSDLADGTRVAPFPADLRVVAGNGRAVTPGDNPQLGKKIFWSCEGNTSQSAGVPPRSCTSGILEAHVSFPDCWDGVTTGVDDTAHMAYSRKGSCAAGWRPVPRLIIVARYPVGKAPLAITLASGPAHTLHADFWNTWDQGTLAELVDDCLNADVDCGANPRSSGA